MAPTQTYEELVTAHTGSYTFDEAIELMKRLDKMPTPKRSITWVDAHTGKPVAIGYND